jgi:hypothetical protein
MCSRLGVRAGGSIDRAWGLVLRGLVSGLVSDLVSGGWLGLELGGPCGPRPSRRLVGDVLVVDRPSRRHPRPRVVVGARTTSWVRREVPPRRPGGRQLVAGGGERLMDRLWRSGACYPIV